MALVHKSNLFTTALTQPVHETCTIVSRDHSCVPQVCGQVLPMGLEGKPAEGAGEEVRHCRQEHAHQGGRDRALHLPQLQVQLPSPLGTSKCYI
jgi:hypothetical protein